VPATVTRARCSVEKVCIPAKSSNGAGVRDAAVLSRLEGPQAKNQQSKDAVALVKATKKIERLEGDLKKHKLALEISGKAHALLEMLAESADDDTKPTR
jgi:hypothetical protein